MSYLRIKQQREKKVGIAFGVFGFFIFLLFAYTGIVTYFGTQVRAVGEPLWWFERRLGAGFENIATAISSKEKLQKQNSMLEEELREARVDVLDRDVLAMENEALKQILERKPEGNFVLATILIRPPRSLYDTFVLDIGTDRGIAVGQEVYAYGNILIGRITTVDAKSAQAILFTAPGEQYVARLESAGIDMNLVGRGGGSFEVTLPRDVVIIPGEVALSATLMPSVVATVNEIISDPRDPFQKVLLESPINIQDLRWVEIKRY